MCPKYPTTPLESNHFVFPQDRDLFHSLRPPSGSDMSLSYKTTRWTC